MSISQCPLFYSHCYLPSAYTQVASKEDEPTFNTPKFNILKNCLYCLKDCFPPNVLWLKGMEINAVFFFKSVIYFFMFSRL